MKRYGSAKIRVDSIIELNSAIKELSEITEIGMWQIRSIEITNPSSGGICEFRRHNPDSNGTSLYFWKLHVDRQSKLYPDVNITDQEHYLGKFRQHFAACKCTESMQKFHGCIVKKYKRKAIS